MQGVKLNHLLTMKPSSLAKYVFFAIIFLILITVGLFIYNNHPTQPGLSIKPVITQSGLEEKYGLRVNLIAVTAAGGMLDLRLKIVNGEKAKPFLQDKNNFPSLLVSSGNIQLDASEDSKSQEISFEKDANIFLMFPNTGGVVQQGTPVTILFGDTVLEPIVAK